MHVVYLIHINTLTIIHTHTHTHTHTPTLPHTHKPWHTTPASSNLPQGYWGMVLCTQLSKVDSDPLQLTSRSSRGDTSSLNTSLVRAMAPEEGDWVHQAVISTLLPFFLLLTSVPSLVKWDPKCDAHHDVTIFASLVYYVVDNRRVTFIIYTSWQAGLNCCTLAKYHLFDSKHMHVGW